jgi:hypothetical protein
MDAFFEQLDVVDRLTGKSEEMLDSHRSITEETKGLLTATQEVLNGPMRGLVAGFSDIDLTSQLIVERIDAWSPTTQWLIKVGFEVDEDGDIDVLRQLMGGESKDWLSDFRDNVENLMGGIAKAKVQSQMFTIYGDG